MQKRSTSSGARCASVFMISILVALAVVIANPKAWAQSSSGVASNSCHLRELDLCAAGLLVLTQSPSGLATNEQEINKQCVQLRDTSSCLRNYTRRCLTPVQRELAYMASNSTEQMLNEYCTRGSSFRGAYLKHATCLNKIRKKEHKSCTADLQAALELLGAQTNDAAAASKRLPLACCAYRKFDACLGSRIEKVCSKETYHFVSSLVRRLTSRLPETLCRGYRPDGQECAAVLPKAGTPIKGPKSSSILSRLMSAYSGL